jgi:hypothetical protein
VCEICGLHTRQVLSRTSRSGIRNVYIREPLSSLSIIDMVGLDSQYGLVKTMSSSKFGLQKLYNGSMFY